jgi:hypothetical protein
MHVVVEEVAAVVDSAAVVVADVLEEADSVVAADLAEEAEYRRVHARCPVRR